MMIATSSASGLPDYGYVSAQELAAARCYAVDTREGRAVVGGGRRDEDYAGVVFPYYHPGNPQPVLTRLRRFHAPNVDGKEARKYLSPPGMFGRPHFYLHPDTPADWFADISIPVFFVEGEKKALALRKYFLRRQREALIVGLAGVDAWRGITGRVPDFEIPGKYYDERGPIYDWQLFTWEARHVTILFDTNIHHETRGGENVRAARRRLTRHLHSLKAVVHYLDLPADCPHEVNGVDDFLSHRDYGEAALDELLRRHDAGEGVDVAAGLLPHNDRGFLDRLWEEYPNEFVYVEAWGKWAVWDGAKWDFVTGRARFNDAVIRTAQLALEREAPLLAFERKSDDYDPLKAERRVKAFTATCLKYGNQNSVQAVRRLAEDDTRFMRQVEDFDANPWLLNCANGTLDLRTGELKTPDRADLITRQLETPYDPEAKCPAWEAFVSEIMLGRQSLIRFVWQMLGYCLTGDISEQVFFILVGKGENGKGVLLQTYEHLLGRGYFRHAAASAFEDHNFVSGHTDSIAVLFGARAVLASETNQSARLNEALIKRVTGERTITASRKGQSNFEFAITFKVLMSVNYMPEISGLDHGIWRRVVPLPFEFTVTERDEGLPERLRQEAAGILAWCVRGLHDKLESGFQFPSEATNLRAAYRTDSNRLGDFLEAACVLHPNCEADSGELWRAYLEYCSRVRQKPLARNFAFTDCLRDKGCTLERTRESRLWRGVGLLANYHADGSIKGYR